MGLINIHHRRFEQNLRGRDIVVGDIHGEFAALEAALREIDFDETKDRLFALGDLVDRGPDSMAALAWLEKPWFYSILGNHEIHHILCLGRKTLPAEWQPFFIPGDDLWIYEQDDAQYQTLVRKLAQLPTAITVETEIGPVGLVHADLPRQFGTWATFTEAIDAGHATISTLYEATWSRRLARYDNSTEHNDEYIVTDVAALFHGHNIPQSRKPFTLGNRHYIETGAFLRRMIGHGGLSLIDIASPDNTLLTAYWP